MDVLKLLLPALLRYALAGVSTWLIQRGIVTPDQWDQVVAGVALMLGTLAWMAWVKIRDRVAVNTALAMPQGSTRAELERTIASGQSAPAATPPTVPPQITSLLVLALALSASVGCGAAQAPIALAPTLEQTQETRRAAARAIEVVSTGLGILDETGKLLDGLPIPDSAKDRYDCAILAVTGTSTTASATVTRVCGAVPLSTVAPLTVALETLKSVSACPSLRATIAGVYGWISPLIMQLEGAESPVLKMAGASLRMVMGLLSSGGVACSA